jgi:hypothetical protein
MQRRLLGPSGSVRSPGENSRTAAAGPGRAPLGECPSGGSREDHHPKITGGLENFRGVLRDIVMSLFNSLSLHTYHIRRR